MKPCDRKEYRARHKRRRRLDNARAMGNGRGWKYWRKTRHQYKEKGMVNMEAGFF